MATTSTRPMSVFGASAALLLLLLAACSGGAGASDGDKAGVPVVNTGGCVNYVEAGGSVCAGVTPHEVYIFSNVTRDVAFQDKSIGDVLGDLERFASPACREASVSFMCANMFPRCETATVGGAEVALPAPLCRSECEAWWDHCDGLVQTLISYNLQRIVPSCGTEGYMVEDVGGANKYGTRIYLSRQDEYPDGLQGELEYPEAFNTWTSPADPSVTVQLTCGVVPTTNASAPSLARDLECTEGVMTAYEVNEGDGARCLFMCPHPLFLSSEYSLMLAAYLVPGLLGGLLCVGLVLDVVLEMCYSRSQLKSAHGMSLLALFQLVVGACGSVFFVIGPLAVAIGGDLGCNGLPVIPGGFDGSYVPNESLVCVLNRGSIYVIMMLFNAGVGHMFVTYSMLRGASQPQTPQKKKSMRRFAKMAVCVAIVVPAVLCGVMFSLDSLDQADPNYQGQLARWSLFCGPRLTSAQETALVYVPFTVTGILATAQSVRSRVLLRSYNKYSVAPLASGAAKQKVSGMAAGLRAINLKVTIVGFSCAFVLVLFVACTIVLVPEIATSSDAYLDWLTCRFREGDVGGALKTAASCAEIFAITGNMSVPIPELNILRPSATLLAFTYFAQSGITCIFGAFYAALALKRRQREKLRSSRSRATAPQDAPNSKLSNHAKFSASEGTSTAGSGQTSSRG